VAHCLRITRLQVGSRGGPGRHGLGPETIVREQKTLKDGEKIFYIVKGGIYRVDVTAVPAPVSITWVGASCNDVKKTKEYSERCYVETNAQLLIENPAALGFIGSGATSMTYTLTRLPD